MAIKNTLLLLLAATVFFACGSETTEKEAVRINVKPGIESTSASAKVEKLPVQIYDYAALKHIFQQNNDTTYVINFWATWCKPCVAELPYFEELNEVYEGKKVKVILVSLDFKRQIKKQLLPFLKRNQLASEVMVLVDNSTAWRKEISPDWGGAIPATLIYNSDKRFFFEQSFEDFDELNEIVMPLVKK